MSGGKKMRYGSFFEIDASAFGASADEKRAIRYDDDAMIFELCGDLAVVAASRSSGRFAVGQSFSRTPARERALGGERSVFGSRRYVCGESVVHATPLPGMAELYLVFISRDPNDDFERENFFAQRDGAVERLFGGVRRLESCAVKREISRRAETAVRDVALIGGCGADYLGTAGDADFRNSDCSSLTAVMLAAAMCFRRVSRRRGFNFRVDALGDVPCFSFGAMLFGGEAKNVGGTPLPETEPLELLAAERYASAVRLPFATKAEKVGDDVRLTVRFCPVPCSPRGMLYAVDRREDVVPLMTALPWDVRGEY